MTAGAGSSAQPRHELGYEGDTSIDQCAADSADLALVAAADCGSCDIDCFPRARDRDGHGDREQKSYRVARHAAVHGIQVHRAALRLSLHAVGDDEAKGAVRYVLPVFRMNSTTGIMRGGNQSRSVCGRAANRGILTADPMRMPFSEGRR